MTSKINHFGAAFLMISALAIAPADAAGRIADWYTDGGAPQDYDFGTEHVDGAPAEKSAFIKCIVPSPSPKSYGDLSQGISAMQYRGKRVRLSAMIKTKDADSAHLWMRMDGSDRKVLSFYNMDDRPVKGTTDWKRYDIVLDVPQETQVIAYGYFLAGKGEAWADDFKIEAVGDDVPISSFEQFHKVPVNMDFKE